MISEGVGLVLALREDEGTLLDLRKEFNQDPHDMESILQNAKVEKTREALNAVVANLCALPHTPVKIEPDLHALRAWIDAHRAEFDAFKTFCDNYRPPSPMEDGEVHPRVDSLLTAVRDVEDRVDRLAHTMERKMQPPWVNDVGPQLCFVLCHTDSLSAPTTRESAAPGRRVDHANVLKGYERGGFLRDECRGSAGGDSAACSESGARDVR